MSEEEIWRQWRELQHFDHLLNAGSSTVYIEVDELTAGRNATNSTPSATIRGGVLRYPNAELKQLQTDAEEALRKNQGVSAADLFEQAILLFEAEPQTDSRIKGILLTGLGQAQLIKGNREEAEETFGQALGLGRLEKDALIEQQAQFGLGLVYNNARRGALAADNLREALVLARQRSDRVQEARTLLQLGIAYLSQGLFQRAVACLVKARQLYGLNELFPEYEDRKQAGRTIQDRLDEIRKQAEGINSHSGRSQYESWILQSEEGTQRPE